MSGRQTRNTVEGVNWWLYVRRIAGTEVQVEISRRTGLLGPTLSRWKSGTQGVDPDSAATFARAYGRPVVEAFVAAGFLTEAEAKVRPAAAPNYSQLTNDQLLDLVRERMTQDARRTSIGAVPDQLAADVDHDPPRAFGDQS